ncbi:MAG TPA: hypothetical protein VGI81_08750 [Tepidisphaeraceae bacterium]|jgi:hypothetical protein
MARALNRPAACFRSHDDSKTANRQQTFDRELGRIRKRFGIDDRPEWARSLTRWIYCHREVWARRLFLLREMLGLEAIT